jgi:hypothetical protein
VGLGNLVYPNTRHSVGISFVERLAKRLGELSALISIDVMHFFYSCFFIFIFKIEHKLTATHQT